ncbi:hypothetical protein [Brevibacterium zhoupengii]|uniref:hypothetical protein n=1 Tax=Brevibacterium zhoupengii TaxID=2898795 RepID=UPI001F097513|nr:hypothetical protein [Brevibacterium zhoupengii]
MKRVLNLAAVVVMAGFLGGCGPGESGGNFEDVDELREAFADAGGTCDDWNQTDTVAGALQSGECSSTSQLSVFKDASGVQYQITEVKKSDRAEGMGDWLTGENWIIATDGSTENATDLQAEFGGQVVSFKEAG